MRRFGCCKAVSTHVHVCCVAKCIEPNVIVELEYICMLGSLIKRSKCCCEAGCIYVCWVGKCIESDVVLMPDAYMYAG